MITRIYGYSDDNIEVDGDFDLEIGCYSKCESGINFNCSDGTKGIITYNGDWLINVIEEGLCFLKLVNGNDEIEHTDIDAKGCTSYSDVLVLSSGLNWIKIGNKTYKNE